LAERADYINQTKKKSEGDSPRFEMTVGWRSLLLFDVVRGRYDSESASGASRTRCELKAFDSKLAKPTEFVVGG
jgi:hypothetical protein